MAYTKNIILLIALSASTSLAEIKTPSFFSDGMVLQQKTGAAIWGWGKTGEKFSVNFAGNTLTTVAHPTGLWKVEFKNLIANSNGTALTITSGSDKKVINDVVVGEVWIASGQSNMEWRMNSTTSNAHARAANEPIIRSFLANNISTSTPQNDFNGEWKKAINGNTLAFTAVGYSFAEKIKTELNVPVGIIEVAWGGKPVESFISNEAIQKLPEAKDVIAKKNRLLKSFDPEKTNAANKKAKAIHAAAMKKWEDAGRKGRAPRLRLKESPATDPGLHSNIYNGMIHPIVGYGVRGAIWYQGEANSRSTCNEYGELLSCMVRDWRSRWDKNLSFYFVQLANFKKPTTEPGIESGWVTVQDEQRRALNTISNSGMATINDIGDEKDIHPRNKKDVGERLALWALAKDYGKTGFLISGPLYKDTKFEGNKATISFDHAKGLKSRDGKKLARFEIAGADGKWVWADAEIKGETVVVTSASVQKPTKVRYAWASNPKGANLVNEADLPTSCFSSDTSKK